MKMTEKEVLADAMRIIDYMVSTDPNKFYSIKELSNNIKKTPQKTKIIIAYAEGCVPIIFDNKKGYKLINFNENSSVDELLKANQEAFDLCCSIENKINELKLRQKQAISSMRKTSLLLKEQGIDVNNID